MLPHILAKSKPENNPETLVEHTDKLISCWLLLRDRYQDLYENNDPFWFDSFITILFHDFGKLSQNFQESIRKTLKRKPQFPHLKPVRHEFLSGTLLLYHAVDDRRIRQDIKPNYAQFFAIITHHKDFKNTLFEDNQYCEWELRETDFYEFMKFVALNIKVYFPENILFMNGIEDSWQLFAEDKTSLKDHFKSKNYFVRKETTSYSKQNGLAHRKSYLIHKAFLVISDWTASGHRTLEEPLKYTSEHLFNKLRLKIGERFRDFREFQLKSFKVQGSVIAIAPTGSGKTEAALLWASKRELDFQRIVYLLPTRITANAIYKRLNSYFGKSPNGVDDFTAVVHS